MDTNKLKKSMGPSALALFLSFGALIRVTQKSNIRTVDLVTILGIGATMGAFLVHFIMFLKAKKAVE